MKRRGRVRQVAKWAGLVVCVVIAGLWIASMEWTITRIAYSTRSTSVVAVGLGSLRIAWVRDDRPARRLVLWSAQRRVQPGRPYLDVDVLGWFTLGLPRPGTTPIPRWMAGPSNDIDLWVSLWMPFVATALPTGWLWWRDRRARWVGHCAACGYDLAGLAAGAVCPECGKASVSRGAA